MVFEIGCYLSAGGNYQIAAAEAEGGSELAESGG
jgi:hypothetical protein